MATSKAVQWRRGNVSQHTTFTGRLGEITVDTDNWELRIHDNVSVGGHTIVGLGRHNNLVSNIDLQFTEVYDTIRNSENVLVDGNARVTLNGVDTLYPFVAFAATPDGQIGIQGGEVFGFDGSSVALSSQNTVVINTYGPDLYSWQFDNSGVLTLPPGGDILDWSGTSVISQTQSVLTSPNKQVTVTLSNLGTLQTTSILPSGFLAYCDSEHYVESTPGVGLDLIGNVWNFQVDFTVGPDGRVATYISNTTVWYDNPGYQEGMEFNFTESDHGIPDYTFTLQLTDIQNPNPSFNIWTTNLAASPAPEYPELINSSTPIKLRAGENNWIFGTDGSLNLPIGGALKLDGDSFVIQRTMGAHIISDYGLGIISVDKTNPEIPEYHNWYFGTDGTFTVPAYNNSQLYIQGGEIFGSQNSAVAVSSNDAVVINTYNPNLHSWRFNNDGDLYLPEGGRILTSDGTNIFSTANGAVNTGDVTFSSNKILGVNNSLILKADAQGVEDLYGVELFNSIDNDTHFRPLDRTKGISIGFGYGSGGSHIRVEGSNGQGGIEGSGDRVGILASNGLSTAEWIFDHNGHITYPSGVIDSGDQITIGTAKQTYQSNGAAATVWTASSANVIAAKVTVRVQSDMNSRTELFTVIVVRDSINVNFTITEQLTSNPEYGASVISASTNIDGELIVTHQDPNGWGNAYTVNAVEFDKTY